LTLPCTLGRARLFIPAHAKNLMEHNLAQTVHSFRGKRVLLIGDLILDRYVYGDAERISPEAPVPVLRAVEKRETVGGSANVAACLTALGCKVACCGAVGADDAGETLRRLLKDTGADAANVLSVPSRATTTKTRLVGLAQHRHRQQLLRLDEEDASPLAPEIIREIITRAREIVPEVDVVCIEDYDKGMVCAELVEAVLTEARRYGRKVLVDPARLTDYQRYRGADVLTPNRAELSLVARRPLDSIEAVAEAAVRLIEECSAGAVVVTLDRDGAAVVEPQGWRHIPTLPRSVYDNTGAGDAVLATLAASIAAGADLETAARLANVAGGLEVEKFGCVPITAEEMLAELRLADRAANGKVREVKDLNAELTLRRDRGETVAFTNGCFDILHAGHVDFLKRCRAQASTLVVGLNSDASVRTLNKGTERPINRFEDRAAVLSALECVDYVVRFNEADPTALIREIRPDVLIKGEDWIEKGVKGREVVEASGGRVVLLPLVEGLSTTKIVERIRGGA